MSDYEDITGAMKDLNIGELTRYQPLINGCNTTQSHGGGEELRLAPLIWWDVKTHLDQSENPNDQLKQYAVLGHESSATSNSVYKPVLLNTNAPWSSFLCGSQGSGKSHTLSCMLENCILSTPNIGKNPHPLAGLVLHYDGSRGSGVCEAAYLCSQVKTRVLVSASNYGNLKSKYEDMAKKCGGTIEVQKLLIATDHLDTERVKTLMAVSKDGEMPLYIQTLVKIIRDIAIQSGGVGTFDYGRLKEELRDQMFSERQNQPLALRIDLLESFLDVKRSSRKPGYPAPAWSKSPDYLKGAPGELLIVDLTDPVVDVDMACVLFDTCLSIFLAQTKCGKVVALDEAHNYLLAENASAKQFTGKLLKTIREQRHLGTRIIIATQEPTLDTSLLDLCSITMVHRCTSPAWFEILKKHVAALYLSSGEGADGVTKSDQKSTDRTLFAQIVALRIGESLLFCPTGAMRMEGENVGRMLDGFITFRTRQRLTADGGATKLAYDT
ncbi:hypothetical protein HBH56_143640 [Parastagonospora nodorum]|uniref:AAA+ ATPase domain-containing protein n=2 Tax=Phaeosphaeria nodorum (strain SN15 / ATCC MYA-4574 / FGSC 10173) TaxID=321614 RepID=A0A7U2FA08_PHANO|nr:hypothetical protein SNOG_12129 [Parastagonospora nodorum SN15]KAH3910589.1 hypothetical protein HBH56_143640 [Parastagonospora nodorum]EAT80541.2 hypothetical protein SNOG_12129 [Parastagonospora nodorum SN15]KAH3927615.1 hypothetical protein HBH54_148830 [Parastagonospora nodorum]KAH4129438.1 hypothetical protein HBH45_204890 [Parastagonospora nodorum]KAH4157549.1 hypothetical protein HBH44_122510 [Parastagonospora nodorum]